MNTTERLKSGQALCPQCGEFSNHHWGNDKCGNNCQHETICGSSAVTVITWENIIERVENFSNEHHDFVARSYPELLQAKEQKEAQEEAELFAIRDRAPMSDLGQSLLDMMAAIGAAQVMQMEIEQ